MLVNYIEKADNIRELRLLGAGDFFIWNEKLYFVTDIDDAEETYVVYCFQEEIFTCFGFDTKVIEISLNNINITCGR